MGYERRKECDLPAQLEESLHAGLISPAKKRLRWHRFFRGNMCCLLCFAAVNDSLSTRLALDARSRVHTCGSKLSSDGRCRYSCMIARNEAATLRGKHTTHMTTTIIALSISNAQSCGRQNAGRIHGVKYKILECGDTFALPLRLECAERRAVYYRLAA